MKKAIIVIITLALVVGLVATVYLLIENRNKRMIELTFTDVQILNEKSNFGGCMLLDVAPVDAYGYSEMTGGYKPRMFSLEGKQDSVTYGHFSGALRLDSIIIRSSSAHLFGIHVGDDLSAACEVMENEGFTKWRVSKNPSRHSPAVNLGKHNIGVGFYVDPNKDSSAIIEIIVGVEDPIARWKWLLH